MKNLHLNEQPTAKVSASICNGKMLNVEMLVAFLEKLGEL